MKNILIIRLSALGDVVFASPLINALRQRHPEARLSWLVEPAARDLIIDHPMLDEVLVWPKAEWKQLWRERRLRELWRAIRAFRQTLKARRFDLVLDLQGLMKSAVWAWLSGAPRRIGLGSREGSHYLMTEVVDRGGEGSDRISSEYRNMADHLGLQSAPFPMSVAISADNLATARSLLGSLDLDKGFIALCPFTTRPQKHWLDSHWRELLPALQSQFDLPLVVLGGPGDVSAAGQLFAGLPVTDLSGKTRLQVSAAVLAEASLVIGVDTGLTHMAIAAGRPTVCVFGSTCPYLRTENPHCRIIYQPRDCSPCRRNPTCDGRFDCMQSISAEQVLQTAILAVAGDNP